MRSTEYQICTRCVMDTSDPDITFDSAGVCSHCATFDAVAKPILDQSQTGARLPAFEAMVCGLKEQGRGKDYDCILGLSGGVDSSYLALVAKDAGLRVLAVHCDAGWNSELAINNIERIVKTLGFDLFTYVLDWEEMRDLQLSFFKASLANCDIPQDHAFLATLYGIAAKKGIRSILSGSNYATEAVLPQSWGYDASDLRHIKSVHKQFGTVKLRQYPTMPFWKRYFLYPFVYGIKNNHILNYIPYRKDVAKAALVERLGWRDYGGKHFESVFTKFFQSYYLVRKFGFDKRRAHLSSLVVTGQTTRDAALAELQKPPYDPATIEADKEFIAKKMEISTEQLEDLIRFPSKSYRDYPSNETMFRLKDRIMKFVRKNRK